MDNLVDKSVNKLVNKYADNTVETMLKNQIQTEETPNWYSRWASFLSRPPFYTGLHQNKIENMINQLCQVLAQGDSCIYLSEPPVDCDDMMMDIAQQQAVPKPLVWDAPYLYLQRYWALEHGIAERIRPLIAQTIDRIDLTPFEHLFSDVYQSQALNTGVNSAFAMITGGPGTGKTYILTRIVAVLKKFHPELRIAMAAPTGKAAQRMQESLKKAFSDQNLLDAGLYHPDFEQQQTQTLHRLLGMGHQQKPKYHQYYPLPYDVVVVDEASMLDLTLAHALLNAIQPPTRLILLGDANQLSSVDVGYVLADLQRVEALKSCHVRLQFSRRFSDEANIGRFARYIGQRQQPSVADWLQCVQPQPIQPGQALVQTLEHGADWVGYLQLADTLDEQALQQLYRQLAQGFDHYIQTLRQYKQGKISRQILAERFDDYRILVAIRFGDLGLDAVNQAMAQWVKQQLDIVHDGEWFYGRPVMMVYNDYQLNLSNGDIGLCLFDPQQPEQYVVYFPSLDKEIVAARLPQSIQTAFALTIHKSQGSEFVHTAVVLDQHAQALLSQELLYTAITRAKQRVSLYSTRQSLEQSLQIRTQRQSGLYQQIQRCLSEQGRKAVDV